MHVLDGDAASAYRRGNPLDRAMANVSDGEDTGHTRLQLKGTAEKPPHIRQPPVFGEVCAREDKPLLIAQYRGRQPARMRFYPDEDE